jgi:hypothetical protein
MNFRHERLDDAPPCGRLGICLPTDLTGNGLPDVVVGGLGTRRTVTVGGKPITLDALPVLGPALDRLETSLFWYENPGWERHRITSPGGPFVFGNALGDIDGDGRADLVVGQGLFDTGVYWFEQPADPRDRWEEHLVTDRFEKYHDLAVADVDDDGEPEVVGLSQESATVFYYDVPADPRQGPWPAENLHVVADDLDVEGVAVLDVDDDGRTELVAGPNVFHRRGADEWERERIAEGWEWTRVATADLDGDGDLEVVLAEGDLPYQGDRPGRVGVFDPPEWTQTVLRDDLSNPHTVQVADFDGDGHPDLYVAEMGIDTDRPVHVLFRNRGDGTFEEEQIERGIPTHEAKAVDLTGNGRPDVVGKSYQPDPHVDVWFNEP